MEMWLVVIFSFLSYSCNGSLVDQSTQSSVKTELKGTEIKMEVDVMKGNYHALLLRVIDNEDEIAFLKGQTQHLVHELENTRRTFTCELQGLRETTIQYEKELNGIINSWNTFNETIQDLSQSVSVLDNKYSLLEIPGRHSNESGDTQECPLGWIRGVEACYFLSNWTSLSWDDAQEQCRKQNGSLADIHSEKEAVWLNHYIRNKMEYPWIFWIGGKSYYNMYNAHVYKWFSSDGKNKTMHYTRWDLGQPEQLYDYDYYDDTSISTCTLLLSSLFWRSEYCEYGWSFICKIYI